MTALEPPPTEHEPDHELDRQAAAEGLTDRTAARRQNIPHDTDMEIAALGSMLESLDACDAVIEAGVTPTDFYSPRNAAIYKAICEALAAAEKPEPFTVSPRITGYQIAPHELYSLTTGPHLHYNAAAYARRILFCSRARTIIATGLEIAEAARDQNLPKAMAAASRLDATADPLSPTVHHNALGPFVDSEEPDYDWIIPGLLERTDRILLTGPEGGGKSTLLRQIAVQAAAGIHPFLQAEMPPLRVLLLDLENSPRHVRRKLADLRTTAAGAADHNLHVAVHPQGLDLTDPTDVGSLTQLIATLNPDLVVGGPIYKLVGGDPTAEEPAKAAATVLDKLRTAYGFALALETHQPHGTGSERPERPYGASLWKRWPEFGLHIAASGQLRHWRGARDERTWPVVLTRGGVWPWTQEVDSKILTFAKIKALVYEHGRRLSEREIAAMLGAPKTTVHNAIVANQARFDAACAEVEE